MTMSVTHHVTINSDDAWIKLEISRKIQEQETEESAFHQLDVAVQQHIIEAIESSARTVMEFEEKDRK